jgi:hypothetical protein
VTTLITFNGSSFDLPVIRKRLFADLRSEFAHRDLLHVCRRRGLRGGLKIVEQRLGIARATAGISGYDAPRLWDRYEVRGERSALDTLLAYNYEDVINLALLEAILDEAPPASLAPAVNVLME